jgi:hypothetical protein
VVAGGHVQSCIDFTRDHDRCNLAGYFWNVAIWAAGAVRAADILYIVGLVETVAAWKAISPESTLPRFI